MGGYRGYSSGPKRLGALWLWLAVVGCGRVGFGLEPSLLVEDSDSTTEIAFASTSHTMETADASAVPADAGLGDETAQAADAAIAEEMDAGSGQSGSDPSDQDDGQPGAAAVSDPNDTMMDAGGMDPPADDDTDPVGEPGMRVVIRDVPDGSGLVEHAVRVPFDSAALIASGQLAADCSNLAVLGGEDCTEPQPFFLSETQCGDADGDLWVSVAALEDAGRLTLALTFEAMPGFGSNGKRVFSFFEDFAGDKLNDDRWRAIGNGRVEVHEGVLESVGPAMLQSRADEVTAGRSVVGARLAARSQFHTDVELGVGRVDPDKVLWAYERDWEGFTFLSWDEGTYAFNGAGRSRCDNMNRGEVPAPLGAPWVDVPPASASFLTVEFRYENAGRHASGSIETSRGASLHYTAPEGCTLPDTLPLLIVLDHEAGGDKVTQRLDYVYVRPGAPSEPTVEVLFDSTECSQ